MNWWQRLKDMVRSEAADVREGMKKLGKTLDDELARKERELEATPAERVDMILEDIESEDDVFDQLEEKVRSKVSGTDGEMPQRRVDRVQILEPADVSAAPNFDVALGWVRVVDPEDAGGTGFDHEARIDETAHRVVGEAALQAVAGRVASHPLVKEAQQTTRGTVLVAAPGLHHEDVRLLVAAAFAEAIPDDWATHTDDRGAP